MTVVGVDGRRGGWVAAVLANGRITWSVHETFAEILAAHPRTVVAVDMPIGVTDGPRPADGEARAFLRAHGGPWQSIFLTPERAVYELYLAGHDHRTAMALRPPGTPGTSIQAWNLLPKIAEVTAAVGAAVSSDVIEAHPECSFRVLDGRIGLESKKTARGAGLRLRAISSFAAADLADAPPGVPVDDVLDAAVLTWTAERYRRGRHLTLPAAATAAPRIVV